MKLKNIRDNCVYELKDGKKRSPCKEGYHISPRLILMPKGTQLLVNATDTRCTHSLDVCVTVVGTDLKQWIPSQWLRRVRGVVNNET